MSLHRFARPALVASVITVAVALAACAGSPQAPTPAASNPGAAAPSAQPSVPPTVKLLTPTEGASVPAGDVRMAVETTGLKFTMPSNALVAGEGHVHFTLDDMPFKMSTEPEFLMKAVTAGPHRLRAELVQNDTSSFDPPVFEEITFTAQ